MSRHREKSNITLSVDKDTLDIIRQDAEFQRMSINAKVGAILDDYAAYGRLFAEKHPITLDPAIFSLLLDNVDEKVFLDGWKIAHEEVTPMILSRAGTGLTVEVLFNGLIRDFGIRVGAFNNMMVRRNGNGQLDIVIEHQYGLKWSRILGEGYTPLIEKVAGRPSTYEALRRTVVISVADR